MQHITERERMLLNALNTIAIWQLPETGKFWDEEKKEPMSYETAWGSNGARDYMKNVAHEAIFGFSKLSSEPVSAPSGAKIEWDSQALIGLVQERYNELERYGFDWKSFYNGWLEGRADMYAIERGLECPNLEELPEAAQISAMHWVKGCPEKDGYYCFRFLGGGFQGGYVTNGIIKDHLGNIINGYTSIEWLRESSSPSTVKEQVTIEQLRDELDDKRVLKLTNMQEPMWHLVRKHSAEHLLDKFDIYPKGSIPASKEQETAIALNELLSFAKNIATDWDCDSDSHRYNTPCRACEAKGLYDKFSDLFINSTKQ